MGIEDAHPETIEPTSNARKILYIREPSFFITADTTARTKKRIRDKP
jgi:hypothetical protein